VLTAEAVRGRSVRLSFQDEARFGRVARIRRCWAPAPLRPLVHNGYEREFTYVYGASVNQQQAISSLAARGWSIRRIARELKVHRRTVKRYFPRSEAASKCATISTAGSPSKCTISTAGKIGRKSVCGSHEKLIEERVRQGLTAQRV